MFKRIHSILLVSVLLCCVLPTWGQVQPCLQGTLADVLGTSCSVGRLTLNFRSNFTGHSAAEIGFVPVQSGSHAGFKLVTKFVDGGGASHIVQFGYVPQAAPNFGIRAAELAMDASAQGSPQGTAFAQVTDFQNFPDAGFIAPKVALNVDHNVVVTSQLTNHVNLEVPASAADGTSTFSPFTTQVSDFSTGTAGVTLNSITFLYTVAPVLPAPPLARLHYTNIDLPGMSSTSVSSINDRGQIVGAYQDSLGTFHGYISEKRGGFTTIDFPGATSTSASGVNNRGDVVGVFTDSAGNSHGFLLQRGSFTQIDVPDALLTFPIAVNDRGQIVGGFIAADQGFHGFLLQNGHFTTIDHGPGTGSSASTDAVGINDHGEVLGDFFDPNTFRGFVQFRNFFVPFDVPGQGFFLAGGINAEGEFVGAYEDINRLRHGVLRTHGRFLTVDFPDGRNTFALALNTAGSIVGTYDDADGNSHSFLAQPGEDHGDHDHHVRREGTSPIRNSITDLACGSREWRDRVHHSREAVGCRTSH